MTLKLTDEQRQVLKTLPDGPVQVVDERSDKVYVLIRSDRYKHLQALLKEDFNISDTYAAQMEAAWRAGWDDPAMGDYNNYDENRKKLCP
jgi:hypothetical protein